MSSNQKKRPWRRRILTAASILLIIFITGLLIPFPWRIDDAPQGWRKMFYLNPIDYLE